MRGQSYPYIHVKGKPISRRVPSNILEIGNLQLWQKVPYGGGYPVSDKQSVQDRENSGASSPQSLGNGQSLSARSIMSSMSGAHTKHLSLGSSKTGIELTRPEPPLLVLFLKQTDMDQLSFLVIELDERTKV